MGKGRQGERRIGEKRGDNGRHGEGRKESIDNWEIESCNLVFFSI